MLKFWLFKSTLLGLAFLGLLSTSGCNAKPDQKPNDEVAESAVSSVPLRVASAGNSAFNERLKAAWRSISEQPIDIVEVDNSLIGENSGSLVQAPRPPLVEAAEKADVIIYPNQAAGDLQRTEALTAYPESFLENRSVDIKTLLPGLAADSTQWGSEIYAIPLGSARPAIWTAGDILNTDRISWKTYQKTVGELEPGQAAEPLAEGWAAISFLWRSSTLARGTWLFDRQTFDAAIDQPAYVRALEQMVEARKNYPGRLLTPAEVWERLNAGELKLGIGWPTAIVASNVGSTSIPDTEAIELAMRPYPLADEIYLEGWRVAGESPDASLLSPTGLTVGIAAACRQTGVARTFVSWLVSREGHQAMRGLDDSVLPNRLPQADVTSSEPAMVLNSGVSNSGSAEQLRVRYDDYLRSQLSTSIIRPTLRIAGAAEYLRILNEAVLVSLSGEQSAQQSLSAAAEQWNALSDRLGRQTQLNAWRQSQGMRER